MWHQKPMFPSSFSAEDPFKALPNPPDDPLEMKRGPVGARSRIPRAGSLTKLPPIQRHKNAKDGSKPDPEPMQSSTKRLLGRDYTKLQSDPHKTGPVQHPSTTLVKNIPTAADVEESQQRTMLEEDQTKRLEQLVQDVNFFENKLEEITRKLSMAEEFTVEEVEEIERMEDQISALDMASIKLQAKIKEKELTIKDYKRSIQEFENMQKKLKHTAAANSRKYKEMWLMCDAEVNQLAERALVIDSLICKNLGLSWEQPPMAFMECSSPIQPQKQAHRHSRQGISQVFQTGQALQCNHKMMGASGGLETNAESSDMEMHKEGTAVQSESGADVEGEELSMETLNKVMEVLYDEVGFLTEGKPLELLTLLEKEEQTVVKLDTLMSSLGIEEKDVPKLAPFLLKYNQQQTEDVCGELAETAETSSMTNLTSELIDPKHVLPALKSFLEQQMRFRESSAHQQTNQLHLETQDSSEDKAYWESMGNIILEDKLKLWDTAEKALKQYIKILTDISDLTFETKSLEHENTELRMLLQQPLSAAEGKESLVKASRVKKHRKTK